MEEEAERKHRKSFSGLRGLFEAHRNQRDGFVLTPGVVKRISRGNTVRCLKLRMQNFGPNYTCPSPLDSPSTVGGLGVFCL